MMAMASQRIRMHWWVWWLLALPACAALSIIIAWACALWSPGGPTAGPKRPTDDDPLIKVMLERGQFDRFVFTTRSGFGWERKRFIASRSTNPDRTPSAVRQMRCGWPFLCMEGHELQIDGTETEHRLAPLPNWPKVDRNGLNRVPLQPMWNGLLLDALVLAIPAHIFFGWIAIRRCVRRYRGLCFKCGYDLRGASIANAMCPECGTPRKPAPSLPHALL
jgi:hypothetical protein